MFKQLATFTLPAIEHPAHMHEAHNNIPRWMLLFLNPKRELPKDQMLKHKMQTSDTNRLGWTREFARWIEEHEHDWAMPPLSEYRDHLQALGQAPASINAKLSTIRTLYRRMADSVAFQNYVLERMYQQALAEGLDHNAAQQAAQLGAIYLKGRLESAVQPHNSSAPPVVYQDQQIHRRLSPSELQQLIDAPGIISLEGIRGTCAVTLMAMTGVREEEMNYLRVCDLYADYEGFDALNVRMGKGRKQRKVPWGMFVRARDLIELILLPWYTLECAKEKSEHPLFCRILGGNFAPRNRHTGEYHFMKKDWFRKNVLDKYPITLRDGTSYKVKAHDTRYTYARMAWLMGMQPESIAHNLGHTHGTVPDTEMTWLYIGPATPEQRVIGFRQAEEKMAILLTLPQIGEVSLEA